MIGRPYCLSTSMAAAFMATSPQPVATPRRNAPTAASVKVAAAKGTTTAMAIEETPHNRNRLAAEPVSQGSTDFHADQRAETEDQNHCAELCRRDPGRLLQVRQVHGPRGNDPPEDAKSAYTAARLRRSEAELGVCVWSCVRRNPARRTFPFVDRLHHRSTGNGVADPLNGNAPVLQCEVEIVHRPMETGKHHVINLRDRRSLALLGGVHRAAVHLGDGRERVSGHARPMNSWYRQIGTERAQFRADVRQRSDEVDVVAVRLQLQRKTDALPAAFAVVDDEDVAADRRSVSSTSHTVRT